MAKSKSASIRPIQVRMPEKLRRQLATAAEHNDHSMNSKIVRRLESSFQRQEWMDEFVEASARAKAEGRAYVASITDPSEKYLGEIGDWLRVYAKEAVPKDETVEQAQALRALRAAIDG